MMAVTLCLFIVAYALMIWAVCQLLASGTRQIEIDYPFTEPPRTLGQDGSTSTEGNDDDRRQRTE